MSDSREDIQELISGYLDGELGEAARREFEARLAADAALRREFEYMRRLVIGTSAAYEAPAPPLESWDPFLDGVYNRLERRAGWVVFAAGSAVLAAYGLYLFVYEPWGPALLKFLLAAPLVGLGILFVSVLRQRLKAVKTDRYTREVHR